MQCEFCGKNIQSAGSCPNCGKTKYTAGGKIIYGATAKDACSCEATITDKYLILRRVGNGEKTGDVLGRSAGLLGMLVTEVAKSATDKTYGYYDLSQMQKAIFPYRTNGIKKNNAIKLIHKNGSDFILIFDKPGFVDGTAKVLKKMVAYISAAVPVVESGANMNFGSAHCVKPFVSLDNFDKIRPSHTGSAVNATMAQPVPKTAAQPAARPAQPVQTNAQPIQQQAPVSAPIKIRCTNCGTYVPAGSKFCNECGSKIERVTKCLRCGEILDDGDKFCCHCGYPAKQRSLV